MTKRMDSRSSSIFIFPVLLTIFIIHPVLAHAKPIEQRAQELAKAYSIDIELNQFDSSGKSCVEPNCPLVWTETSSSQWDTGSYELARTDIVAEELNRVEQEVAPAEVIPVSAPEAQEYTVERSVTQQMPQEVEQVSQETLGQDQSYQAVLNNPPMVSAELYPKGFYYDEMEKSSQEFKEQPKKDWQVDFGFSTGLRRDHLEWNIAGNTSGTSPNILSELKWDDVDSYVFRADGKVTLGNHWRLEGFLEHGEIFAGDNQDSDYTGDNRTGEYSRSTSDTKDNHVIDLSGGAGYQFPIVTDSSFFGVDQASWAWLGGYSFHRQDLRIKSGVQRIPASGAFRGLNSKYDATWKGPWLGAELVGEVKKFSILTRFEYHWADYYADANWNLRDDFQHPKSFDHEADGHGLVWKLGLGYTLDHHWSFHLNGEYQDWLAENGTDTTYFKTGPAVETRLNEVKWTSKALMLEAKYRFGQ